MPSNFLLNFLTFIHVMAGLVSLIAGGIALSARRKGAVRHRGAGRVFLRALLVLALSAAILLCFRWNPFFFALSIFSFYFAFSGWRVLKRKSPHTDRAQRAHLIDWCAAMGTTGVAVWSLYGRAVGLFGNDAAVVLGILGFAALAAVYDLWRFAFPMRLANLRGLWLLEHLTKMTGAFIAVVCAFSATTLTRDNRIPDVIAQTVPAVIGTPILLFFANRQWRQMRRPNRTDLPAPEPR